MKFLFSQSIAYTYSFNGTLDRCYVTTSKMEWLRFFLLHVFLYMVCIDEFTYKR